MTNQHLEALRTTLAKSSPDCILVVGSGLSVDAGLPTWPELARQLQDRHIAEEGLGKIALPNDFEDLSLWSKMGVLERVMTDFRAAIREALGQPTPDSRGQNLLRQFWNSGVRGVVTLNLDKIAEQAFGEAAGRQPNVGDGRSPHSYQSLLGPHAEKFVFHPHGILDRPESWVLTDRTLNELQSDANYKDWWNSVACTKTLVFIGIGVSDHAILPHISLAPNASHHYWVRPSFDDPGIDKKLLNAFGIREIAYARGCDKDPHAPLADLVENLLTSPDAPTPIPSAFAGNITADELPPPEELRQQSPDAIRAILNNSVATLLPEKSDACNDELEEFESLRAEYRHAFAQAYALDQGDTLHGYTLKRELGGGTFGQVFEATDAKGTRYAIKIIHASHMRSGRHLNAFRRGAQAMRLLRGQDGAVDLIAAYEVPFAIVMPLVNGCDVGVAFRSHLVQKLETRLIIVREVVRILARCHRVDMRVLHRDIKPGNVLVESWHPDNEDDVASLVRLVDFDLAWHDQASEEAPTLGDVAAYGYAAPEFFKRDQSSRQPGVDVYGVGMLLYYLLTGDQPKMDTYLVEDLSNRVCKAVLMRDRPTWSSVAWQLGALVRKMTIGNAEERCSLGDADYTLSLCIDAMSGQADAYAPLLARELAARATGDDDTVSEVTSSASGLGWQFQVIDTALGIFPQNDDASVVIAIRFMKNGLTATGSEKNKRLDQHIGTEIKRTCRSARRDCDYVASKETRECTLTIPSLPSQTAELERLGSLLNSIWTAIGRQS